MKVLNVSLFRRHSYEKRNVEQKEMKMILQASSYDKLLQNLLPEKRKHEILSEQNIKLKFEDPNVFPFLDEDPFILEPGTETTLHVGKTSRTNWCDF